MRIVKPPVLSEINYVDYNPNDSIVYLASCVKEALDGEGYIVIRNFYSELSDIVSSKRVFLEISEEIGQPISHDGQNSIIWDIKSNPKSDSLIKTYSEHSHEAELHTDSQYSEYPEDYFGLLTLKKALCGGGRSLLLSLKDILTELRELPEGFEIEKTLRESDYPFIVPNVFKKDHSKNVEFNFGPILRNNEIRFRVDTFEKAISNRPDLCTGQQLEAYQTLKEIILNSKNTKYFYLENRDLIFINNKTMLHGRESFTDSERHLLRIRMNKLATTVYD
ncbi:MAG: TauD/TfdA family dioxygenase [Cyclobacteriaceae bacterium]